MDQSGKGAWGLRGKGGDPSGVEEVKAEAARSLFPRLIDRNHIFGICDASKGPYFAPMCGRQRCAVSCDAFVLVGSSVYNHEFPDVAGGERPLASRPTQK